MIPLQPLPTVVGPTENALRALLAATLGESTIGEHIHWVTLNAASRQGRPPTWRHDVATSLRVAQDVVDAALDDLQGQGLVDASGDLTDHGQSELSTAREAVRSATALAVAGIPESDLRIADRVLRAVHDNVERLLAAPARPLPSSR